MAKRWRVIAPFKDHRRDLIEPATTRFYPAEGEAVPAAMLERLEAAGCLAPAGEVAASEAKIAAKIAAKAARDAEAKAEAAREAHQAAEEAAEEAARIASEAEAIAEEAAKVAAALAAEEAAEEASSSAPLASYSAAELKDRIAELEDPAALEGMLLEETEGKARKGVLAAIEARLEELGAGAE